MKSRPIIIMFKFGSCENAIKQKNMSNVSFEFMMPAQLIPRAALRWASAPYCLNKFESADEHEVTGLKNLMFLILEQVD